LFPLTPERTVSSESIHPDIARYHAGLAPADRAICELLAAEISRHLPEAEQKVWHAHPVWFLDGNPILGYSKLKGGVRLMFWSGQSFDEPGLVEHGAKFKDASVTYTDVAQVRKADLKRWCGKGREIQWDYKNLVKRKGRLERVGERGAE
jgi:hypothetical protein